MKLFYRILLCSLLAFVMLNAKVSFGQNAKIDSLINELSKAKEDTNKVKILNALLETQESFLNIKNLIINYLQ